MRFSSLKFLQYGMIVLGSGIFMIACNEAGNNSTASENKGPDSMGTTSQSTTKTDNTKVKRTGKASVTVIKEEPNVKIEKDRDGYYMFTEVLPAYNGGQEALESYITTNIQYPQEAVDNNAEGTVRVQFAVDERGNISNVSTVGARIGYGLEEEAVRVVAAMPKWTPGQVKGKNVKTWRTLPITYRLES